MWAACLFTVLMMLHVTLDVFLRVAFNSPLTGTFELVANYYMVAVMFLPLSYVSRTEGQIVVELFTRGFSEGTLLRWDVVVNIITAIYVGTFAFYTGLMAIEQTETGEIMEMGDDFLAVWPARWLLPIAFGMMAIYLLVRVRPDANKARNIETPVSA